MWNLQVDPVRDGSGKIETEATRVGIGSRLAQQSRGSGGPVYDLCVDAADRVR